MPLTREQRNARRRKTPRVNLRGRELTQEVLHQILRYDPETGLFTRLFTMGAGLAGQTAGALDKDRGYIVIRIFGRNYLAHRLVWLYVHGRWPTTKVDHRNRIRHDNRLNNLREATDTQNAQNTSLNSRNTSGHKGVSWNKQKGKWRAVIVVTKKQRHLGHFADLDDAVACRLAAEAQVFGEFAAGRHCADVEAAKA